MNRILTLKEVGDRMFQSALDAVGGDERAAKILLVMMSPMFERPCKADRDYLKSVIAKLDAERANAP